MYVSHREQKNEKVQQEITLRSEWHSRAASVASRYTERSGADGAHRRRDARRAVGAERAQHADVSEDVLIVEAARAREAHRVHRRFVAGPHVVVKRRHIYGDALEELRGAPVLGRDGVEAHHRLGAEGQFGEVRCARAGQAVLDLRAQVGQRRRAAVDAVAHGQRPAHRELHAALVIGVALERAGEVRRKARVAKGLDVAQVRLPRDELHLALQRLAGEGAGRVLEPRHGV